MTPSKDFHIENDTLVRYTGNEERVIIPQGIANIGAYAFENCKTLKAISFPNSVIKIEDFAFKNCISLTSLTIPDSVKEIKFGAFCNCENLSITLSSNTTHFEDMAFHGCQIVNIHNNSEKSTKRSNYERD